MRFYAGYVVTVMRVRLWWSLGLIAAGLMMPFTPGASAAAAVRAPSLGPPPTEVGVLECSGITTGHCIADVWPGRFDFKLSPHVVRVGETIGATVSDGTDGYGHSWSWGEAPGTYGTLVTGKVQPGCSPPPGKWLPGPSSGHCSWKMTAAAETWTAASACINPLGQTYCDEDYYAVLDHRYLLHGYVRDAAAKGVAGARIELTGAGQDLYTLSRADGYYDAVVKHGTYSVHATKPGVKLCAAQRPKCENPTPLKMVSDKELDFGPPSGVVVEGHVRDHRGQALGGVSVEAVAIEGGKRSTATTDTGGAYRLELSAGAYNVRPVLTRKTDRERYTPPVAYFERATGTVTEDFQLAPGDGLDLSTLSSRLIAGLWWTTVTASGSAQVDAAARIENGRGDPVAEEPVTVDAPYWDVAPTGSSAPEVVICDDSWQRVYPSGGFEQTTNADGTIGFHMFFGGVLGNFYLHAREKQDVTVFDVERFGQLGQVGTVDHDEILMALKTNQGYGPAPTNAKTAAQLQEGLIAWLLARRAGIVGPAGLSPMGEFAPIKNSAGTIAAIVFYPAGDPLPLRAHLLTGAPLPAGYQTRVLRITSLGPLGAGPILNGLPTLGDWERSFGAARYGFLSPRGNANLVFLGFPYPPAATDPLRSSFDRCVPGTNPLTVVQSHSPARITLRDNSGHSFDVDARGRIHKNQLAATYVKGRAGQPDTYILPADNYTATITGTGRGPATVVISTPGKTGDNVEVFSLRARKGATGKLTLRSTGAARTLRFGGVTVHANTGIALRVSGIPHRLIALQRTRLALRVVSQFGQAVAGALITATGNRLAARALTDARGRATLIVLTPRQGRVRVRIAIPGYATASTSIPVSNRR